MVFLVDQKKSLDKKLKMNLVTMTNSVYWVYVTCLQHTNVMPAMFTCATCFSLIWNYVTQSYCCVSLSWHLACHHFISIISIAISIICCLNTSYSSQSPFLLLKTAEPEQFHFNLNYSTSHFTVGVTDKTQENTVRIQNNWIFSYLRLCNEFPQQVTIPYKTLICLEQGQY